MIAVFWEQLCGVTRESFEERVEAPRDVRTLARKDARDAYRNSSAKFTLELFNVLFK